ncbi:c-type cytochrome domain-containing protein [Octadecabacter sp. R77987]|uniref:c-type cytochrome domain-containing protein n=1 Tax=Octadecabacter sp. R77987 TaxID=3093874 RepID=UPI00366FA849
MTLKTDHSLSLTDHPTAQRGFARNRRRLAITATVFGVVLAVPTFAQSPLWPDVSALLTERCVSCHAGEFAPLGLALDSHEGVLAGSENGPIVVPGDVAESKLPTRLREGEQPQMPLDGPPFLEPDEIALIEAWIAEGAQLDAPAGVVEEPPVDDGIVTFSDVDAILRQRCIVCHSDNSRYPSPPEGLRLTNLEMVLRGGERVVVVPGNAEASELWRRVAGYGSPRMPFDGPPWLTDAQIETIRIWIEEGAVDDAGNPAPMPVGARIRLRGYVTGPNEIDGARFSVTGQTRVEDRLSLGDEAEVRGRITPDGTISATRLRER